MIVNRWKVSSQLTVSQYRIYENYLDWNNICSLNCTLCCSLVSNILMFDVRYPCQDDNKNWNGLDFFQTSVTHACGHSMTLGGWRLWISNIEDIVLRVLELGTQIVQGNVDIWKIAIKLVNSPRTRSSRVVTFMVMAAATSATVQMRTAG